MRRAVPGGVLAAAVMALLVLPTATAEALSISVPGGPVNLGSGSPGQTLTGNLGSVTVSDSANLSVVQTMTVTVSLSAPFTVTQGGQTWSLPASRVSYWSGPLTASNNLGACAVSQPTSAAAVDLSSSRTAFSCLSLLALAPSFTFKPTLVVTTPATIPAGTFTGTITHSVA